MRYLFRGLIRETGRTVEGAVEAESAEDALTALSNNGIVTEDLTPAPVPIGPATPRAAFAPASAGRAGAPPVPLEDDDGPAPANGRPAQAVQGQVPIGPPPQHPDLQSNDPIARAFAEASQAVSFDAVAQRYRGKSVWVIDRDKIRRQVAGVVDKAIESATEEAKKAEHVAKSHDEEAHKARLDETGDRVRESVASALKELFKDSRNISSEQSAESVAKQRMQGPQAAPPQQAPQAGGTVAASTPQLEALAGRLEAFLGKAETVLTQLQVAARRVGSGGGGGGAAGFGPRRMSHIPKPRNDEQNDVLMQIFKSNVKLRDNLKKADAPPPTVGGLDETPAIADAPAAGDAADAPSEEASAEKAD